jgi:hypothetical protein
MNADRLAALSSQLDGELAQLPASSSRNRREYHPNP